MNVIIDFADASRRRERARFLLARSAPPSRAVVRHGSFSRSPTMRKKKRRVPVFSRGSNHQQRGARSVRILRREKASARSICSRFVPARTSRSSCRMFLRSSASWMFVLLHEGILEPALGITPQSVTKEANLTYEREAANAARCGDSAKAQIRFCSTRATSKKSSRSRPQTKSCRKNPPTFFPSSSVESR